MKQSRLQELLCVQRDVAIALGSTSDPHEALDRLLQSALEVTGLSCGGAYLVEDPAGLAILAAQRGLSEPLVARITRYPAVTPRPQNFVAAEPIYGPCREVVPDVADAYENEDLHALAVVPVSHAGGTVAELHLAAPTYDEFSRPIRDVLEAVTAQVGGVVARIQDAAALRASAEGFRQLVENSDRVFWLTDWTKRELLYVNPSYEKVYGCSRQSNYANRRSWIEVIHPDDRARIDEIFARKGERGEYTDEEYRIVRDDGIRWIHDRSYPIRDAAGQVYRFVGIAEDITERKRAEEELRRERDLAQRYLNMAGVMLLALDPQGMVTLINRKGCELLGYPEAEIVGANWIEKFIPRSVAPEVQAVFGEMMSGEVKAVEYHENPVLTRSGEQRLIAWHNTLLTGADGRIISSLSSGEDITERRHAEKERRELEAQLHQAQKMEAVGQLAGGIAHDFNNILTAILGNVEMLLAEAEPASSRNDKLVTGLEQIDHAGQRAATLTRQLLAFSRRQVFNPKVVDANQTLRELEPMLARLLGEHVTLDLRLAPGQTSIHADAGQLEQILMNLVVNAKDAMPSGGSVTIETSHATLDDECCASNPDAKPGPCVLLAVNDAGIGMDAQTRERIFEPFFTTKPMGKGTGLGLSTVYGIVKQAGGHITVQSEPGQGATFKVYLPAAHSVAPARPTRATDRGLRGGHETVLVCEDEATVRALACQFLEEAGYTVLPAEDGRRGLEIAARHDGPIHLLLTDVVMPGMDGAKLARSLHAARPDTRVLYVSGYTADVIARHGLLYRDVVLLEKPFSRRSLLENVRNVLDGVNV